MGEKCASVSVSSDPSYATPLHTVPCTDSQHLLFCNYDGYGRSMSMRHFAPHDF